MLLVKAQLTANDGKWDELKPLLDRLVQLSSAEDGCIHFEYFLASVNAAYLVVLQEWKDRPSLERHEASDHVAEFKSKAASLMERRAPTQVYFVDQLEELSAFLCKN